MTIIEELRKKKSVYNRDLLDRAASIIERLDIENKRFRQKERETSPDTVWICVYKDTLGFRDGDENITMICLPTRWLKTVLKEEGIIGFEPWLETYTADETESIAIRAMREGIIVDFDEDWMKPYFATGYHIFEGMKRNSGEWIYGRLLADNVIVPIGQEFEVEDCYVASELKAYFVDTNTVSEFPVMYGQKLAVESSEEEAQVIELHSVKLDDAGNVVEDVLFTVSREWLQKFFGVDNACQLEALLTNSDDWDPTEVLKAARKETLFSHVEENRLDENIAPVPNDALHNMSPLKKEIYLHQREFGNIIPDKYMFHGSLEGGGGRAVSPIGVLLSATKLEDTHCPCCEEKALRDGNFGADSIFPDYRVTCDACGYVCPCGSADCGEAIGEFESWMEAFLLLGAPRDRLEEDLSLLFFPEERRNAIITECESEK